MESRKLMCVAVLTLFAAVPIASASTKWYVDGKHGNDNNNCKSRQHACRTISNAISLTLPGDLIFVAAATYHANGGFVSPSSSSPLAASESRERITGWHIFLTERNCASHVFS